MTLLIIVFIYSCDKQSEEIYIIPEVNIPNSTINVGYESGKTNTNITSNVIYYVTVDEADKDWLKYSFTDSCQTLWLSYTENTDTMLSRTGHVTISIDNVSEIITVFQAKATPPRIKPVLDIEYQLSGNSLVISAEECVKIPLGSFIEIESSSQSGSFQLSGFDKVFGNQIEGKFGFVWTAEMDSIGALNGLTGLLGDGFTPSKMYASYVKKMHSWKEAGSVNFGGVVYNFIEIPANETPNIPIRSTIYVECPNDVGAFIIGFSKRLYPSGGEVFFPWKTEYINQSGVAQFIRTGGFEVSKIYSTSFRIDLFPEVEEAGVNKILTLNSEETAYIPIGATVVIKCEDDHGTISINGFPELTGSPVNGEFSFIWTSAIRNVGELKATISNGSKPLSMYFRN